MTHRGQRIELTTDIESLGDRAPSGDQGTVQGFDPDGYLEVRMDDGRTHFPHQAEIRELPE